MKGKLLRKIEATIILITLFFGNICGSLLSTVNWFIDKNESVIAALAEPVSYQPIRKTQEGNYDLDGTDIIGKATELLGKRYWLGGKGIQDYNHTTPYPANQVTSVDCSGLAYWTLNSLGGKTTGFNNGSYPASQSRYVENPVPMDTDNWLGSYWKQVFDVKYNKTTREFDVIQAHSNGKDIYEANLTFSVNSNTAKGINVLKVNDMITEDFRYYNYMENGVKKELPMGTIIASYGKGLRDENNNKGKYNHTWIYIGDLGTDKPSEVKAILDAMLGKDLDINYIVRKGSSTHWRIESSGDAGVTINNGDPNIGETATEITSSGKRVVKGIGPVWAFQVANDVNKGEYSLNIAKRADANFMSNTGLVSGAKFKLNQNIDNEGNIVTSDEITTTNEKTNITFNGESKVDIKTSQAIGLTGSPVTNNKYDIYTIEETYAPETYKKLNLSSVKIYVCKAIDTTETSSNKLKVRYVRLDNNDIELGKSYPGGEAKAYDINGDGINDIAIQLDSDSASINIEVKNDKAEDGKYQMNIAKKSRDGIIDAGENKTATFAINQYINTTEKTIPDATAQVIAPIQDASGTAMESVVFNNDSNITISNSGYDTYDIFERSVDNGYFILPSWTPHLSVQKEIENGKYVVKKVSLSEGLGRKLAEITKNNSVRVDDLGQIVTDPNAPYSLEVSLADTNGDGIIEINIVWTDPKTEHFQLGLLKKEQRNYTYGNAETLIKERLDSVDENAVSGATYNITKNILYVDGEIDWNNIVEDIQNNFYTYVNDSSKNTENTTTSGITYVDAKELKKQTTGEKPVLMYAFEETSSPDGYAKNNCVYFVVASTKENAGQVLIDDVKVFYVKKNSNGNIPFENGTNKITITECENTETGTNTDDSKYIIGKSDKCKFRVDYNTSNVIFTAVDTKLEGNYDLSMVKREAQHLSAIDNINELFTEDIAGGVYEIKQYLNVDKNISKNEFNELNPNETIRVKTNSDGTVSYITDENNKLNNIFENVNITDVSKMDVYVIEEIEAPKGYLVNDGLAYIMVHKKENTDANGNKYYSIGNSDTSKPAIELGWEQFGDLIEEKESTGTNNDGTQYILGTYYPGNVDYDLENGKIVFTSVEVIKRGLYWLNLNKVDASTRDAIKDNNVEFDIRVFKKAEIEQNSNVVFSNPTDIYYNEEYYEKGEKIELSGLKQDTDGNIAINKIYIDAEDAENNQKYYFVINEKNTPKDYLANNYQVVLEVTFAEEGMSYKALCTNYGKLEVTSENETSISGKLIYLDEYESVDENDEERQQQIKDIEAQLEDLTISQDTRSCKIAVDIPNTPEAPETTEVEKTKVWEGVDDEDLYRATFKLYKETYDADLVIQYIEDLVDFSKSVEEGNNYANKNVVLLNDVDFNEPSSYRDATQHYGDLNGDGTEEDIMTELTKKSEKGFTPIGTIDYPFAGNFYGQGHEIRNLYCNSESGLGLFGFVKGKNTKALIRDLGVTGEIIVTSPEGYAGGIASSADNCSIINCYNKVHIKGGYSVGGIVGGANFDIIKYCHNEGIIENIGSCAGGIVGITGVHTSETVHDTTLIDHCYNNGEIKCTYKSTLYMGGIVGEALNLKLRITNCYNTANITREYETAGFSEMGGIVGRYSGHDIIENCYNTGNISFNFTKIREEANSSKANPCVQMGGIVGRYSETNDTVEGIINCYNLGKLSVSKLDTDMYVGGIIGNCEGNDTAGRLSVSNCYNAGEIVETEGMVNDFEAYDPSMDMNRLGVYYQYSGEIAGAADAYMFKRKYNNCYYTNAIHAVGNRIYGYNSPIDVTNNEKFIAVPSEDMKTTDFVSTLNQYVDEHQSETIADWIQGENGYPALNIDYNGPETQVIIRSELVELTEYDEIIITSEPTTDKTAVFKNLPVLEDGSKYIIKETKVEKYNKDTQTWEELVEGEDYTVVDDEEHNTITNTFKKFDLSLRKYISKVERNGNTIEIPSREPIVDVAGLKSGSKTKGTTAYYNHSKTGVTVEKGDIITYSIRVYNEGKIDGYANAITDYLPEGLEFIDNDFNKVTNGWTYDEETHSITTNILSKEKSESNIIKTSGENVTNESLNNNAKTIQVQLKVSDTATEGFYMTNRAEITTYGYYNDKNEWKEANTAKIDRDSEENTIKDSLDLNNWHDAHQLNLIDKYIPGAQDDDDFETVYIEKEPEGSYSIKLVKTTNNFAQTLTGTKFTYTGNEQGKETNENGEISIVDLYTITKENVDNIDLYTITEVKVSDNKYAKLKNPIKISVVKTTSNLQYIVNSVSIACGNRIKMITKESKEVVLENLPTEVENKKAKVKLKLDTTTQQISIYVDNTEKEFDLSLRKFITKIGDTTYNRAPTEGSIVLDKLVSGEETTAVYNHTKQPLKAKHGDKVVYTLRVYNEGELDGYATEITDHLPENLEFVPTSESTINDKYGWQVSKDGKTVTTSYLKDTVIKKFDNKKLAYVDVEIECRISANAKSGIYLTNIAEITKYDGENHASVKDRDNDSLVPNGKLADLPNYNNNKLKDSYVPGNEDDDDFEKVYVEPDAVGEYNFTVTKKDAETDIVIDDEKTLFNITVYSNKTETSDGIVTFSDKDIVTLKDKEGNTINTKISVSTNGVASIWNIPISEEDIGKTFYYVVEELEAPDEYTEIDYKIVVPITFSKKDNKFIAKHENSKAFALVKDADGNEIKKELKELSTNENECASTEQTDVAINVNVPNKHKPFDLSLRKFITRVNDEEPEQPRVPKTSTHKLENKESTTAEYAHSKMPLLVSPDDIVEYTIRIYNEGERDGYASLIIDDVPEGVTMLPAGNGEDYTSTLNAEYRWRMFRRVQEGEEVDPSGIIEYAKVDDSGEEYPKEKYVETLNPNEAEIIVTDYLSMENGQARMTEKDTENPNLIHAFNPANGGFEEGNYKDIKVQFKVKTTNEANKIITNYAQIAEDTDKDGEPVKDKDSTTNTWIEDEDDQDVEHIQVRYFDLALYKWVSSSIVTEKGKTTEFNSNHTAMNKQEMVDIVIPKDQLNKVVVKFKYQIRVTNQSQIEGYAKEITDHIPEGLKFVAEDNKEFGWVENSDGTISTDYLKDTLLEPGDTAEVTVILTWINGSNNLGLKTNYAEISEDYNEYNAPDIDSTPGNFKNLPKEDDEDGDVVILQIRTGINKQIMRIIITVLAILAIITSGAVLIKEKVTKRE